MKHVAVITKFGLSYEREAFAGISRYAAEQGNWELYLPLSGYRGFQCRPQSWRKDGIIHLVARIGNSLPWVTSAKVPRVRVCDENEPASAHVVMDDAEIGRVAARHFLDKGFLNLAFCGQKSWSSPRGDGFCREVQNAKGRWWRLERDLPKEARDLHIWHHTVVHWLWQLPKPVGILACNDLMACQLLGICAEIGIRVPEEIAVVGVDNDDVIANLAVPSLSSVEPDFERAGYEAAALLDRLMAGEPAGRTRIVVSPIGVMARRSSDILAISDPEIGKAMRRIQDQAHNLIMVDDVLAAGGISRRSLERRFRKLLGRSVHDEINRVRLVKARRMLASTNLDVLDVAIQCGFANAETFYRVFRLAMHMTPTEYRRQFQLEGARRS